MSIDISIQSTREEYITDTGNYLEVSSHVQTSNGARARIRTLSYSTLRYGAVSVPSAPHLMSITKSSEVFACLQRVACVYRFEVQIPYVSFFGGRHVVLGQNPEARFLFGKEKLKIVEDLVSTFFALLWRVFLHHCRGSRRSCVPR